MVRKICILCFLVLISTFFLVSFKTEAESKPRVAIISAFGAEITKLKDYATVESEEVINGRTFTLATLEGDDVVMFLSGVSMVNAAMTTQLALDTFDITHIVFSGIAGGVNPKLNIGDVVIPAKWGEYQEALYARDTVDGWNVGWHDTPFDNFYMIFPQYVEVAHSGLEPDEEEEIFWFMVNKEMLSVASNITVDLKSEGLTYSPRLVVGGNGVSGMTFIDNAKYRKYVFKTFQADCLDMESAAVAHVAYVNHIPFIAFRSLSDLAGGGKGENEIGTFFQLAADNAAAVLIEWFKDW